MDETELTNLTREYVNELHPDFTGNDDNCVLIKKEADEAAAFMRFLLRKHSVVPTDTVKAHYIDAYLTAGLSRNREERLIAEAVVRELESLFGEETFENLEEY